MIYAFDPGKTRIGYAGMDPITRDIRIYGMMERDPDNRHWWIADLRDRITGNDLFPFPMTVALIEDQFIKLTRSAKTMAGIAARTMDLVTVAAEIRTVAELNQVECHMIHPKTWQSIFKGWSPFPRKRVEIEKAALAQTAELGIELTKAKQDVASAICMLHWYEQIGEEKLNDETGS